MSKKDFNIVFISSYICGGKSFIGEMAGIELGYPTIEVSSIVKEIMGESDRDRIISKDITNELCHRLAVQILFNTPLHKGIIVIGLRELNIFDKIVSHIKNVSSGAIISNGQIGLECIVNFHLNSIWIEVPRYIRELRYTDRNRIEDRNISFKDADNSDAFLGIDELRDKFIRPICITPQHYFISSKLNDSTHMSANVHNSIQLEISELLIKKEDL